MASLDIEIVGINYDSNVKKFANQRDSLKIVDAAARKLSVWAYQLEVADEGNPALYFLRSMLMHSNYSISLISLALYTPAAATMRAMFESALWYSFFRTHPTELCTMINDASYYVQKKEVVEFHVRHTPGFKVRAESLGLLSQIDQWYSTISGIVHGQTPIGWVKPTSLTGVAFNASTMSDAIKKFFDGTQIVHNLFLSSICQDRWCDFAPEAKRLLLKGLPSSKRQILKLTIA